MFILYLPCRPTFYFFPNTCLLSPLKLPLTIMEWNTPSTLPIPSWIEINLSDLLNLTHIFTRACLAKQHPSLQKSRISTPLQNSSKSNHPKQIPCNTSLLAYYDVWHNSNNQTSSDHFAMPTAMQTTDSPTIASLAIRMHRKSICKPKQISNLQS